MLRPQGQRLLTKCSISALKVLIGLDFKGKSGSSSPFWYVYGRNNKQFHTSLSLLALASKEIDKTSCTVRNFTKLYHIQILRVPLNPLWAKYSCYTFKCRPKLKQVFRRRYLFDFFFFEWKIHINGNYRFAPSEINLTQTEMAHLTSAPPPLIYDL